MKKLLCFFLLIFVPLPTQEIKFYCCVIMQDGSCYEEYLSEFALKVVVSDFCADSNIESVFVTRDISYVP